MPPAVARVLDSLLTEAGVAGTHGIEMLRLVRAVDHGYDRLLNAAMHTGAITAPRWRILLRLWVEEQLGQGAVSPTHLSRTQQLAKNTISDHLRTLEEAGLIVRELDRKDRRQFQIRLTDAGRDVVREYTPAHAQRLNQLLAGFSTQEVATLQALLGRLHAALCAMTGGAPCTVESEEQEPRNKEPSHLSEQPRAAHRPKKEDV